MNIPVVRIPHDVTRFDELTDTDAIDTVADNAEPVQQPCRRPPLMRVMQYASDRSGNICSNQR